MKTSKNNPPPASMDDIFMFRKVWKHLARKSQCDGWSGMECRRVFKAWVDAGMPEMIHRFILDNVNVIRIEQADANLLWSSLGLRRSYPRERRPW